MFKGTLFWLIRASLKEQWSDIKDGKRHTLLKVLNIFLIKKCELTVSVKKNLPQAFCRPMNIRI